MRRYILIALLLWGLLAPAAFAQAPQAQTVQQRPDDVPTIRREVQLVNLVMTVLNRRQKFVTNLERKNFKVTEDGRAQDIQFFSRETDLPLRVGLLLDTSNSIRERLKFEQEAAIDFIHNVIRRKKDLAFLMTFDNEPQVVQEFTDDTGTLTEAIHRQRAGGGTALYDAMFVACRQYLMNPPPKGDKVEVRRVLVIISDGSDNLSDRSRGEAIEMCLRAEASIYTISTSTDWLSVSDTTPKKYHKTEGDKVLENLSEETGGRAFFPYRVDDLAQSFLDIGTELRSQYSLAYVPTNRAADGKFRVVRVEVDRKGLSVRTRKGYYAPRATPEPGKPAAPGP